MVAITLLSSGGAHFPSIAFHAGNVTPLILSLAALEKNSLHLCTHLKKSHYNSTRD